MSQINVNNIRAKDGVGAVGFPGGINATGVVTATSFSGNLTGNVTGNLTGDVTGNTSGTAGGLTGTPNITVGTVTGTDATFSGNLTVNGTTTTIDTVVSAVDSLQVDGNVGIGTTIATSALDVRNGIIVKDQDTTQNSANPGLQLKHNGTIYGSWRHDGRLEIGGQDGNSKLTLNANGLAVLKSGLDVSSLMREGVNITAGKLSDNLNIDLENGMVHYFTTTETTTSTPNIRYNASTTLASSMEVGEAISVTLLTNAAAAGYSAQLTIDGGGVTEEWSGGSAPSSGGSGGIDLHTYTIVKTGTSGTPNSDFLVLATYTNFD
tara:strand:- start:1756 stop:2718 length:963 start_codon:yes stop_codon:yes gene_type:complete